MAAITVAAAITACSSPSSSSTTISPPPADAAKIGVPFLVREGNSSAEVTLTKITYTPTAPDGTQAESGDGEYAILHVKIVGTSATPFKFGLDSFAYQATDEPDSYQPVNSHVLNVDPQDWMAFPNGLESDGTVTKGKSASGILPFEVLPQTPMLINMYTVNGIKPIAQWLAVSP